MLNINKIQEGSKLIIELEGKMDAVTAPSLGKVIEGELSGVTELIFDLKKLEYTSSAGLRQFLMAQQIMDDQGSMIIINANDAVLDILEETGFMDILSDVEMRNMKQRHTAGRTLFLQNLCIRLKIILLFRMSAVWK